MSKALARPTEIKQIAKRASVDVLNSIAGYADMIGKLREMIDNEESPALVRLNAVKAVLGEYSNMMNFETKNPKRDDDLTGFSDSDLDELIENGMMEGDIIDIVA